MLAHQRTFVHIRTQAQTRLTFLEFREATASVRVMIYFLATPSTANKAIKRADFTAAVCAGDVAEARRAHKLCYGTNSEMSSSLDSRRTTHLKARYENCTHVIGNLELADLSTSATSIFQVLMIPFMLSHIK